MNDYNFQRIKIVSRTFHRVSDGTHGNTQGFHGSLTPGSLHKIFREQDLFGRNFVDLGAGDGKILAAALVSGASRVHGIELPGNQANHLIFLAAMRKIRQIVLKDEDISSKSELQFEDIEKVLLAFSLSSSSSQIDVFV
jgi:hypothetical protein